MERALETICYVAVGLLAFAVVIDVIDDVALGNRWAGATAALVGLVTACLTALVTYRARRGGDGSGKTPRGEGA